MAKSWYILQTYTGYELKIERTIRGLLEKNEIDSSVVTDVRVPVEEISEIGKNGKPKIVKDFFMPGYLMIEMDLPDIDWKKTCTALRKIQGVNGFVGTDPNVRPRPISTAEAVNLLTRIGVIKGEKQTVVKHSFAVGDTVKISDGPFATFTGIIKEVMNEKEMLKVEVQIFGRPTPVELSYLQAEKV